MKRRDLVRMMSVLPAVLGAAEAAARQTEASRTRGLPPLRITGGRVITTGGGAGFNGIPDANLRWINYGVSADGTATQAGSVQVRSTA